MEFEFFEESRLSVGRKLAELLGNIDNKCYHLKRASVIWRQSMLSYPESLLAADLV